MESNNVREVDVRLQNYAGVADLSPVGTFVFCILCFAFWAADLGLLGDGATTAIGFLGLAVFVPYLVAGVALSKKGLCLGGNTYVLFGAVFGSCGGLFNTFDAVFAKAGIPFDYSVVGIAFTLAGLYLACMLPAVSRTTKVDFFIFFFGACGVLGSGLTVLGILPATSNLFNGWALFLDGVVGFYAVIATVSNSMGMNLPFGKPFVQPG